MKSTIYLKGITLLVTHYNRSNSLKNLLDNLENLGIAFENIIVSDDGSKPEHQKALQVLQAKYNFKLITTSINKGLGNNINKGQDAVETPYTLYVQEDFVPLPGFHIPVLDALNFMEVDSSLDIARFYAYFPYPYVKEYGKGFSLMIFKPQLWFSNHLKFYYYSDHPHLRRSTFFNKFGKYIENTNSDICEFTMCLSFIKNKGKGLIYNKFTSVFDQVNTSEEPSTAEFRSDWKQKKKLHIQVLRWIYLKYRFIKNSFQLVLFK
ncbi:MAG: glycosyltransferase [Siphonobacter sp.]